jgi:hypothetical protein
MTRARYEPGGAPPDAPDPAEEELILESAAECLRFEQESFGALHQMLGKLDDAAKAAVWAEVGEKLAAQLGQRLARRLLLWRRRTTKPSASLRTVAQSPGPAR